jgi:hypothetical protein
MFVGNAKSLPKVKHLSGTPLNGRLWPERLAKDKHSSLLQKFVNYRRKKFYKIVPW